MRRGAGLDGGVPARFESAAARWGNRGARARVLLTALAWGRGPGLPREGAWGPVANALAACGGDRLGAPVTDGDVRWLLRKARDLVAEEPGPGGQPYYRLRDNRLPARPPARGGG